jgi:ATP-dependent Clp protease ATP-binding subunit ClpA
MLKTIRVHSSAQLTWSIANNEACLAGSELIEPLHLFFALLKILDEAFHQDAERIGLTPDEIAELAATAAAGRQLIDIPGEEITRLRRSIHNSLRTDQAVSVLKKVHRSPECIRVFDRASEYAVKEGSPSLRSFHLLKAVLVAPPPDVSRYLPSRSTHKPALNWETRINEFVERFQLTRISLVLTDMENSMLIKQRYGDVESAKIFRAHDDLVRLQLARFQQAREIKTIGDSFLLSFASEEEAVWFALVLQSELRGHKYLSRIPVKVRVGVHSGEILSKVVHGSGLSDPIFGITIDITSRIASLAAGDQILAGREIYDKASPGTNRQPPTGLESVQWISHGLYQFKGLDSPVEVFEVGEVGKASFVKPAANEKSTLINEGSTIPVGSEITSARRGGAQSPLPHASSRFGIGRDLTALALEGRLPIIVGRKDEMRTLARILQRTSKRNVILVGASGVGKSAIVEGLAQRSILDKAPLSLRSLQIIQFDTGELVSRTIPRVDLEKRLQWIIDEAASDPNLVLFFDDIHLAFEKPSARRLMGLSSILRSALLRIDLRCIGATTPEHFVRYIDSDHSIKRSTHILQIKEPSVEEAVEICSERARRIESIQDVVFTEDAIVGAVLLSNSLIQERSLPEKAIDVLENAAAFAKVSSLTLDNVVLTKGIPQIGRKLIEKVLQDHYGLSVLDDSMATKMSPN